MRQLLGDRTLEESILKQLFLQRLSTNTQLILAPTSDTVSIEQLATVADKISEVAPSVGQIATVNVGKPGSDAAEQSEVTELRKTVEQLSNKLEALEASLRGRPRYRAASRYYCNHSSSKNKQSHQRSPPPKTHEGDNCWYHWRFGDKAHTCVQPCTYKSTQENDKASN